MLPHLLQSQRTSSTNQGHLPFTNTRGSQSDDGLDSSHNHPNISTQSSDVMEHVTFLSAKRAIWQRPPQGKISTKDVRNLRRDGLESLGIAPTSHFTNDRPQYLSHSQQESCRGANIVPKDIAVPSCYVLDTEVSRRLMHQRTSDPPLSGNERTEFL
jgi:hypothetical protein